MFLTFLFRSAPEEGLYCKPKYRAKKFVFLKNKYISVILAFVVCSLKLVTSAVGISLPLIFSIRVDKPIVSDFKGKDCGFMPFRCAQDTIYIKSLNNLS